MNDQHPEATPAMDDVPVGADEYAGEPADVSAHDMNEAAFLDADPEDVAFDDLQEPRASESEEQARGAESYFLAPSLVRLREEVNERWPRRDRASDGWIGDPGHAARKSDHNPDYDAPGDRRGVVRALDIDVDDNDPATDLRRGVLNVTIGDPRVWYVISDGYIYSVTYGWAAHKYYGENQHFQHVHVSIRHESGAESDTSPWWAPERRRRIRPLVDLSNVQKQAVADSPNQNRGVRRVQRALNAKVDAGLTPDGVWGPKTRDAYRSWERKIHAPRADGQPGRFSMARLGRGRFRLQS